MDEKITGFITTEFRIKGIKTAPIDILLLAATVVFGILLRSKIWNIDAFWDTETAITGIYQQPILVISIIADLAAAIICALYVYDLTKAKIKAFLACTVCFLSPAMAIGSAAAKTGDGIFVSLFVIALLIFGKKKYVASGILLFLSAAAYTVVPEFSPWYEHMHKGKLLSFNFPNIYQLTGSDAFVTEYETAGYALTAAVLAVFLIWAVRYLKQKGNILTAGLAFSFIIPFIMPGMDERAGLLSMLLSLCFVMVYPGYYYLAIAEQISCFMAWAAFFRGSSFLPLSYAALARLILILIYICKIIPMTQSSKQSAGSK